jgi:putative membrane protein
MHQIQNILTTTIKWLVPEKDHKKGVILILILFAWVFTMILTPILLHQLGDSLFSTISTITVIIQFLASLLALTMIVPWKKGLAIVVISAIFTYSVELLGSKTGVPFGSYHYTDLLKPQLLDVPLLIPLAWLMMLPPAWAVTTSILGNKRPFWVFSLVSGLVFTAWDLFLDPQMVSRGLWVWHQPGGYFGIPWTNYLGWWASATLLTTLLTKLNILPTNPLEYNYTHNPLVLIYTITWILQAIGLGIFWNQPGPGVAGFLGMGFFAVWAWKKDRSK